MRIDFSKIETEANYDFVRIESDSNSTGYGFNADCVEVLYGKGQ